ncbi:MAG: UDP-N-acetylmuramate dehydrogenase [Gammaproteobacteria bacterium]|nr:MAG: UDP-N-acetylmuramate dehydrogenase [Gammaproteobacteria bacterium]
MTEPLHSPANLQPWLTLATPATCRALATISHPSDVLPAVEMARRLELPWRVLGGGSNTVVAGHYDGVMLHMVTQGVEIEPLRGSPWVRVVVEAGESWPRLVRSLAAQGLGGIENLALIPGTAGAAPVQNIGAYGCELSQVVDSVEILDTDTGKQRVLQADECQFGYRDSLFKRPEARGWVIIRLTLRLKSADAWRPHLDYGDVARHHQALGHPDTPAGVVRTIETIRSEKLPDPAQVPNVGSFFKNPILGRTEYMDLKARFPTLPGFSVPGSDLIKVPAAWLIEQAGFKGHLTEEGVGMSARQALVLVNPGRCSGHVVLAFAREVQAAVRAVFGVELVPEPDIVGA